MGMIRLLDENTINKIAAGEVIERPASIIKELVENSIDAGANLITIEIENGGIKKIRVMDNGCGMAPDDLSLAFERHSTSKISDFTDLNDLNSLGFRGEALSSIAAVSMATLKTKRSVDEMGAQIEVSGGKAGDVKPCGLSAGTSIIVENLFYNTPARFKFLKSVAAEAAAITDLVSKLILSHPDISFKYINNGATVFHSSGNGDIMNAASCVFGRDILDNVFSLEYVLNGIHVFGYCGYPQFSQKSRRYQSVFVNRRFIKSQLIASSVQNAYSERLLKGLFPFVLLYLDMPANYFDVNVHPK
ncbi:MAG: DNA mismatch repair endonuclease MutL [Eubacteriales bacterium]